LAAVQSWLAGLPGSPSIGNYAQPRSVDHAMGVTEVIALTPSVMIA
jgi:hypothetical protein